MEHSQVMQGRAKLEVPCAACRMLHRKCSPDCMLAPYFPAEEPEKFASVHKVFGASNVIKMLQTVEEAWRDDVVKSLVYEAYARIKDPVYGCTIAISHLQKCVEELQGQLKATRERVLKSQEERDQLLSVLSSMLCGNGGFLFDNSVIHDSPFGISRDYFQMI